MDDIYAGCKSSNLPHNGGLDKDGVNPYQCPSNLLGSQKSTRATVMSGMEEMSSFQIKDSKKKHDFKWYVVLFDRPHQELKFQRFVYNNRDISKNILQVYCPTHTVVKEYYQSLHETMPEGVKEDPKGKFLYKDKPLFAGSDFVYATYQALNEFLKTYYPSGRIQFKRRISPYQQSEPFIVPDKEMDDFRDFNENFADSVVLLQKTFKDYSFNQKEGLPNDTLKIVDGPMAGLTGYLIRINGNKGLAFQVRNPYGGNPFIFGIPNIWNFHVVRVHNNIQDRQSLATVKYRAVDLLIGILQKSGYVDENILDELYVLIKNLQKSDSHLHPALAENIKNMANDDKALIMNLIRYENDEPGFVRKNWSKLVLRPFLTPSSGIEIPSGKDYVKFSHSNFTEIIKRTVIEEEVYNPSTVTVSGEESIYYSHIGLMQHSDKDYTLFINWDGFLEEYFATDGEARKRIIASFADYTPTLFNVLTNETTPIVAMESMMIDERSKMNVLATSIHSINVSKEESIEDNAEFQKAIQDLIDTGVKICKEINSSSHLAIWRNKLSSVWLHR